MKSTIKHASNTVARTYTVYQLSVVIPRLVNVEKKAHAAAELKRQLQDKRDVVVVKSVSEELT
eukprot:11570029-Prorocentrum_lima.AAC.1